MKHLNKANFINVPRENTTMKREKMNTIVNEELGHIPKGPITASPQRMLRAAYNMRRRHDLGKNPYALAKESLLSAIEAVKKDNPDFVPSFDRDFFGL